MTHLWFLLAAILMSNTQHPWRISVLDVGGQPDVSPLLSCSQGLSVFCMQNN
eukprot:m.154483 g.154483  ORF g.154483 m.154483 type:complete len:52 (+) comp16386_c0_seq9:511-666(+)